MVRNCASTMRTSMNVSSDPHSHTGNTSPTKNAQRHSSKLRMILCERHTSQSMHKKHLQVVEWHWPGGVSDPHVMCAPTLILSKDKGVLVALATGKELSKCTPRC